MFFFFQNIFTIVKAILHYFFEGNKIFLYIDFKLNGSGGEGKNNPFLNLEIRTLTIRELKGRPTSEELNWIYKFSLAPI